VTKENQSTWGKVLSSAVLSTISPTRASLGSNPGLHHLSHATTFI